LGDAIKEHFYAIGSGGGYAIGALSMGASLDQALEVAAKWDSNTRLPMDILHLRDLKKRRG
jgi:ATP-dependent protease HslVU (ClpYQ) peptidase subunit